MTKPGIGISLLTQYSEPMTDVLRLIRSVGFDAISPPYSDTVDVNEVIADAKSCGLHIQSLHAPYGKSNALWQNDETAKRELLSAVDVCIRWEIPVLVMHTWIGFTYTFDRAALNFDAFDEIVSRAKAHGVKIAFENTEGEEFLDALMERFQDEDTVGFCWDSGHELCYNRAEDMLGKYGNRLMMTHLNDNLGISRPDKTITWTDDLHLLPFDGVVDWDRAVDRLKTARRLDTLNFELKIESKPNRHENDAYGQMRLEQYFQEAYARACKISQAYLA